MGGGGEDVHTHIHQSLFMTCIIVDNITITIVIVINVIVIQSHAIPFFGTKKNHLGRHFVS